MPKMVDVLEHTIVENFQNAILHSDDLLSEQLYQSILTVPEADLKDALSHILNTEDIAEVAAALEIPVERIAELQAGIALKDGVKSLDTLKVIALSLAIETNTLSEIEISDCLVDFPI